MQFLTWCPRAEAGESKVQGQPQTRTRPEAKSKNRKQPSTPEVSTVLGRDGPSEWTTRLGLPPRAHAPSSQTVHELGVCAGALRRGGPSARVSSPNRNLKRRHFEHSATAGVIAGRQGSPPLPGSPCFVSIDTCGDGCAPTSRSHQHPGRSRYDDVKGKPEASTH